MYWERLLEEISNKESEKQNFLFANVSHPRCKQCSKVNSNRRIRKMYYLGDKFVGVYFSRREAECMLQLLRGKTINMTAEKLGLSPRTVEFYLKNMKKKLGCNTKSELISIVVDTDFLSHVDFA